MTRRKNRNRLEMSLDVLRVIKNGTEKPTQISGLANLSWRPLKQILGSLVSEGLIKNIDVVDDGRSTTKYEISQKGKEALRYFGKGGVSIGVE